MSFADYASFMLRDRSSTEPVTESELKGFAERMRTALLKREFDVGDVFGSSTDLWGFGVQTEFCEVLVDVSPPEVTTDRRWGIQVMLSDPGWFKSTREKRISAIKRVEWALHEALLNELGTQDLYWLLEPGRVNRRPRQKTP
jgi:hypothetical protein